MITNGQFGALLGALVAIAIAFFMLIGGEHVSKKTVHGDNDLPPVARGK